MKDWKQYQENTAIYFRSLGLEASTDVTVHGVRTNHDIDVLVKSHHAGFNITWIVECKLWKTPVNKLHVLALREIVSDLGADRGILPSETGFQSGAIEAANLTNVQTTSLAEISESAKSTIYGMRLRDLYDRVGVCKDRYWSISKHDRIKYGLRTESADYSSVRIIEMCTDLLTKSFRGTYPFISEAAESSYIFGPAKKFNSPKEVSEIVEKKYRKSKKT
ncbi:restriction endonuclease [Pseudomonas sp. 910_21]|uniref:restriction endonuclease n=1 Tax=Pseudomonas sp. 910_21 TaxID=2604460 RepID=UPI004062BB56